MGRAPLGSRATALAGVPANLARQLVRFAAVGAASTLAYVAVYALLRGGLDAQPANLVALALTALANTAANRRLTFGVRGGAGAVRHHAQGLLVFALGLALTSGALAVLGAVAQRPPRAVELAVLTAANLAATLLRFLLLRGWVFRPAAQPSPPPSAAVPGQLSVTSRRPV